MRRFTVGPRRILPVVTVAALCLIFAGMGRADSPYLPRISLNRST
jgi:hypothetical protein